MTQDAVDHTMLEWRDDKMAEQSSGVSSVTGWVISCIPLIHNIFSCIANRVNHYKM